MREPGTARENRVNPVLTNKHSQTAIRPARAPIDEIWIPGQKNTNIYIRYSPIRH
jgi:hypothetical protein